ncbi:hypothetical protein, partial [Klebsiella pneumoniae]
TDSMLINYSSYVLRPLFLWPFFYFNLQNEMDLKMNIKKTTLADGRQGITIFAEPDIISEMVALCKQRNIPVEESPEVSQETLESLTKTAKQISAIEKVKAIADELKNKKAEETQSPKQIIKNILKGKK